MAKFVTCPACSGEGVIALGDAIATDAQTLADLDQTGSDRDQSWADQDQTASDHDQRSSDADQKASDIDFAAGSDPVVYESSSKARRASASDRAENARRRDATAAGRLAVAEQRDREAETRDRDAEARDLLAALRDHEVDESGVDSAEWAARSRERAALDRMRAADDRARAAADRAEAARQRLEASMAHTELRSELNRAATDPLTGSWTRLFGLEQIAREIERAHRTKSPFVLAFVDVDELKEVNDSEGHAAGDELLHLVVQTMQEHLRPYDTVARYGGDEFLCAMADIGLEAASIRMRAVIAALRQGPTHHPISFGLAELQPGERLQQVVDRADAELLRARAAREPGA